jgi:hypothetical protein
MISNFLRSSSIVDLWLRSSLITGTENNYKFWPLLVSDVIKLTTKFTHPATDECEPQPTDREE